MTGKGCGYRQVIYWGHYCNPPTPVPKSALWELGCTQLARVRKTISLGKAWTALSWRRFPEPNFFFYGIAKMNLIIY